MSDEAAAVAAPAPSAIEHGAAPQVTETPERFSDASEAARFLSQRRVEKRRQAQAENPDAPPPADEPDSGDEPVSEEPSEQAAPADEAPAVEPEAPLPAIEPPVSWPKEDKAFFATLPREAQEIVARREQERDRHFLKSQTELTEQAKAERQQAEQLRQHYESQLPVMLQAVQAQFYGEFADIKTPADAARLSKDDPLRYLQYTAKLQEVQQWQSEAERAHQRQMQETQTQLQSWAKSQDEEIEREFAKVPEAERKALAQEAKRLLTDYGFTEQQLSELWGGSILRSAPLQRMMADAARYNIAKRSAAKPAAKPVPPVQKPGSTARPHSSSLDAEIKSLESKSNLKPLEAARLVQLKAQRRSAA